MAAEVSAQFAVVQTSAGRDGATSNRCEPIPSGGKLACALAAANRTPAEFDHPDDLRDMNLCSNRTSPSVWPHR